MNQIFTIVLLFTLMSGPLHAQEAPLDPIEQYTFEPELVMQNQRAIGLTDVQRKSIKKEILVAQAKFTELEWDLQSEMESFVSLLKKERVDEQRALSILKKGLALESEIKQTHLILAIRLKNILTPEQQAKLRILRNQMPRVIE